MKLPDILVALGVDYGDVARFARNAKKDRAMHTNHELKKEFGNMIFSLIRWADDLGYDPEECINIAIEVQKKFVKKNL